ncbi:N-acetylmuramoyl-L-alanine amidase [Acidaminococcus intestini]|jgi:N-acetylmuramoyl-L-alanine amidase|uniref:N-acetylmuramoyl-L-alanine amidase family protein n=1 Tax=Acidaminococcus intestini TaxID=187327 RepID=UPI002055F615|nr:N-acetylmuramoyl-L-alanine amidase [uncultured Megasphaera sp.]DAM32778.1 MAG TPA: Cell wall hydrolase autolysin [Caudoviricetes sp.]
MKVFLNPGHAPNGHPDPGAVNEETGLRESDVALAVGKSAASYLNAAGVETELLQSDSLEEICEAANTSDANIFVSIHCNAAEAEEANGTETWACAGSYRGGMLANCIQRELVDALGTTDRGVKIATPGVNGLYVLTNTDMPAVLIELAFITNPRDENILAHDQDALARAVARGVTDYEQLILGGK